MPTSWWTRSWSCPRSMALTFLRAAILGSGPTWTSTPTLSTISLTNLLCLRLDDVVSCDRNWNVSFSREYQEALECVFITCKTCYFTYSPLLFEYWSFLSCFFCMEQNRTAQFKKQLKACNFGNICRTNLQVIWEKAAEKLADFENLTFSFVLKLNAWPKFPHVIKSIFS